MVAESRESPEPHRLGLSTGREGSQGPGWRACVPLQAGPQESPLQAPQTLESQAQGRVALQHWGDWGQRTALQWLKPNRKWHCHSSPWQWAWQG